MTGGSQDAFLSQDENEKKNEFHVCVMYFNMRCHFFKK